ncbi:hypothetical protein NKH77_35900 [Streptomyces sp. M19]
MAHRPTSPAAGSTSSATGGSGHRTDRLRPAARAGQGPPPEGGRLRLDLLPRHPDYAAFRDIADEVGAYLVADAAHPIGLVAGAWRPARCRTPTWCARPRTRCCGAARRMILCGRELAERVDRAVFPFCQGGAQMHTIAAKAVAFGEAASEEYAAYTRQVVANARVLAAALAAEGLDVVTGGTDTHLITADPLRWASTAVRRAGVVPPGLVLDTCAVPSEAEPGGCRTGVRLGTAAVTTQGMREAEMARIAELLAAALREETKVRDGVAELVRRFPPYPG